MNAEDLFVTMLAAGLLGALFALLWAAGLLAH